MMGASGGFPIDLVLFGMIAAFLVLRLRSILGRRTGFERPPQAQQPHVPGATAPVIDGRPEPATHSAQLAVPEPETPIGQTLSRMRTLDRSFEPRNFLAGAEKAFRLIVEAFASGDRTQLRSLLSDDTYHAFEQAISARENAGQIQASDIRAVNTLAIEGADLHNSVASLTVRIGSDQVNLTRDKNGAAIAGTDAVTEINDVWTFERDLASQDPTWRLIAARST